MTSIFAVFLAALSLAMTVSAYSRWEIHACLKGQDNNIKYDRGVTKNVCNGIKDAVMVNEQKMNKSGCRLEPSMFESFEIGCWDNHGFVACPNGVLPH